MRVWHDDCFSLALMLKWDNYCGQNILHSLLLYNHNWTIVFSIMQFVPLPYFPPGYQRKNQIYHWDQADSSSSSVIEVRV